MLAAQEASYLVDKQPIPQERLFPCPALEPKKVKMEMEATAAAIKTLEGEGWADIRAMPTKPREQEASALAGWRGKYPRGLLDELDGLAGWDWSEEEGGCFVVEMPGENAPLKIRESEPCRTVWPFFTGLVT